MPQKAAVYGEREIAERLTDLPGWRSTEGALEREYRTDTWPAALLLVNAIGYLAETADHHPDLTIQWKRVTVRLATHSAGGVTDKDFAMARRIERLASGAGDPVDER
jgi:4a-hydroxytetrahydrobiopterin dehydratase